VLHWVVAQFVVRFGIDPAPAVLQLTALLGSKMPAHGCWANTDALAHSETSASRSGTVAFIRFTELIVAYDQSMGTSLLLVSTVKLTIAGWFETPAGAPDSYCPRTLDRPPAEHLQGFQNR